MGQCGRQGRARPHLAVVPPDPEEPDGGDRFGVCPYCVKNDGYYNAGKTHVFVCHEHRVSWRVGSNLFASWRAENEAEQQERYREIEGYEDVTPRAEPTRSGATYRFGSLTAEERGADVEPLPEEPDAA